MKREASGTVSFFIAENEPGFLLKPDSFFCRSLIHEVSPAQFYLEESDLRSMSGTFYIYIYKLH